MYRSKKSFLLLALIGATFLGIPPPTARADFDVQLSYGGGTILIDDTTGVATATGGASLNGAIINGTSVSGTSANFTADAGNITVLGLTISPNGTNGGFTIAANIASTNSPGSPTGAMITESGLSITNLTNAKNTLTILTGSTGFTDPSGATILSSTLSASAGLNANATVTFNSYLNNNNSQFGTTTGTPQIAVGPLSNSSASGNTSVDGINATTPYSLTQAEQITLAAGGTLFDGSSGTTLVTPAPGNVVLAASALPMVLGGWLLRRRRQLQLA